MTRLQPLVLIVMMAAQVSADDAPRLTPGPQTTIFTEPVRDDGTIDYGAAINALRLQEVPADHNAYLDLMRLMPLDRRLADEDERRRTFESLGVAVEPHETPYISLEDFAALREGKPLENEVPIDAIDLEDLEPYTPPAFAQHFDAAMQAPWTRQDYPLIADWLDANAETLTRLETASHRRGYFAPYIGDESLFEGKLPGLHFARDLARMLTARAQLHIGQGDLDGAWRDLLTLKRFGRLMQQSGPIITRLVGMSLQHLAYGVIDDLLSADDLKHEQAVRMISDMAALAPENWLIDAIDRDERWMALDALMRFVMQPQRAEASPFTPDDTNRIGALIAASRGFDMNPLLRGVNGHFDQVVQMLRSDASPEQKMQQRKEQFVGLAMDSATLQFVLEARLQAKGQPMPREMYNEQLQRLLSMLVRKDWLPACIGAYRSQLAQQLKHQVEVAAVAIAAYGVQRGHYPDTLDDLVRQYLPSVPRDADGRPLRYRREGHDASVYSIGPDLADNGGLADSDDDIVMYLRGHSANDGGDEH